MLAVILVGVAAAAVALAVYLGREGLGRSGLGLAALRTFGLFSLALLFFNPSRTSRVAGAPPTVLLDGSLSMDGPGGHWRTALDTALALAPSPASVLMFGTGLARLDTLPPSAGSSELTDALRVAVSRGGPVIVVTDGEIADGQSIPPSLLRGVRFVLLPRDTVPNVSIIDVDLERRVQRGDSIAVTLLVARQGELASSTSQLEIRTSARRLLHTDLRLGPGTDVARRTLRLRPGSLAPGTHVLTFALSTPGDAEPGDDVRWRLVTVTEQPAIAVVVDTPDWEGRFLASVLLEVVHAPVRSFARVGPGRWVDMRTQTAVSDGDVRRASRSAGLVIARAATLAEWRGRSRQPSWHWAEGLDLRGASLGGDWYVGTDVPSSPLAGRLAAVRWDSVPPLTGVRPLAPGDADWVGLAARSGRRGTERPVLVGRDSGGVRRLVTAGGGFWRWAFRGGAPREAYRAVVASGVDWLLGAAALREQALLTAAEVVPRGRGTAFRWTADSLPDSVVVHITGADTATVHALRFDGEGAASLDLDPGVYQWAAPDVAGAGGVIAVEGYSDEHRLHDPTIPPTEGGDAYVLVEVRPRDRWWWFAFAVLAFVGEWAWRLRRGLP